MEQSTKAFFQENKKDIMRFAKLFLSKLTDDEIIENLAEKDLEKLARIFKLMFEKLEESEQNSNNNMTLEAILTAYNELGGDVKNEDEN